MAGYDFRKARLYIDARFKEGHTVPLDRDASNYLRNVLRLKDGDSILVFNGCDGEWQATLSAAGKRALTLVLATQTRRQPAPADLHYLFAPIKHARLDYMVQKAVELGATKLQPVLTQHTQTSRVNLERMRANAVEAAQQCGILNVPEIAAPVEFKALIARATPERLIVFCDEAADVADPVAALGKMRSEPTALVPPDAATPAALAVLVGPEGGFSDDERAALLGLPNVLRLALGPRVLRADTAAVAALTLVQAVIGDWAKPASSG